MERKLKYCPCCGENIESWTYDDGITIDTKKFMKVASENIKAASLPKKKKRKKQAIDRKIIGLLRRHGVMKKGDITLKTTGYTCEVRDAALNTLEVTGQVEMAPSGIRNGRLYSLPKGVA